MKMKQELIDKIIMLEEKIEKDLIKFVRLMSEAKNSKSRTYQIINLSSKNPNQYPTFKIGNILAKITQNIEIIKIESSRDFNKFKTR